MKKLLLISFISIAFLSCHHNSREWTDAYYKSYYKYIYDTNSKVFKNENQRKAFTDYEIDRLKEELPDGFSSIPPDSLQRLCKDIGLEYNSSHNTATIQEKMPWSPAADTAFRAMVLKGKTIKSVDPKLQSTYCDCLLAQLKIIYPDSVTIPMPDTVYKQIVHACNVKLGVNAK